MDGYRQIGIHTSTGKLLEQLGCTAQRHQTHRLRIRHLLDDQQLIRNRGGLHNRLTHHLIVKPFTLHECEEYFKAYHFGYSRKQIAECYMVMGGIPYYLSMMDKSKSLAQNIDQLFSQTMQN